MSNCAEYLHPFDKVIKKLVPVKLKRSQVMIIKRTLIHAGWFHDGERPHYRIFYDVGDMVLPTAGHNSIKTFTIQELKTLYGAEEDIADGIADEKYLKLLRS